MERTAQDYKNWNKGLVGKMFYHTCEDDKNYYRSIYVKHNPFTNALQPMISNPVYGTPPEELEPIPKMMLTQLMRVQNSSTFH